MAELNLQWDPASDEGDALIGLELTDLRVEPHRTSQVKRTRRRRWSPPTRALPPAYAPPGQTTRRDVMVTTISGSNEGGTVIWQGFDYGSRNNPHRISGSGRTWTASHSSPTTRYARATSVTSASARLTIPVMRGQPLRP